jgi:hypothetical protein
VLYGDATAARWYPLARALGTRLRAPVEVVTSPDCAPAPARATAGWPGRYAAGCDAWRRTAVARIAELRPRLTLVAASGEPPRGGGDRAARLRAWTATFDALREAGAPVVYAAGVPHPARDPVLAVLSRGGTPGVHPLGVPAPKLTTATVARLTPRLVERLTGAGVVPPAGTGTG